MSMLFFFHHFTFSLKMYMNNQTLFHFDPRSLTLDHWGWYNRITNHYVFLVHSSNS
jgi:hypothetical protein